MTLKNRGRLLIYNARLILENSIKDNSWVLIDKGKIGGFGSGKKPLLDKGTFLIDCRNNYLSPGLIDLHIHGDIEKISQTQACSGTTGFLLSLYAANFEDISRKIIQLKNMPLKAAQCLGFHLEGPFISREMAGAQPKEFISNPKIVLFKKLLKKIKDDIKIITFACELPGSGKFLKELKKNDIVAALGHTNATFEQAERAVSSGACYSTHIFNRMSAISSRSPGVAAEILLDQRITAEIIADARHVHPALLKLLVKVKPADKIILVTDSVEAMDRDSLKIIKGVYRMKNQVIAGSRLKMLQAVKNMVNLCDVSLPEALKMASANPSAMLGLAEKKGKIKKGFDADILIFDENFKAKMTIVGGKVVYKK